MAVRTKTETSAPQPRTTRQTSGQDVPRRRRKNSTLGADPRGDTGVGAIATNLAPQADAIPSPTDRRLEKGPRERKRWKTPRAFRRWKRMSFRHTWVNPLILILVILAAYYVNPGKQNPLHYAIHLAYADPPLYQRTDTLPAHVGNVTQYGKGPLDLAFVGFYSIVFTFTREFTMQRFIKPIALYLGIRRGAKLSRFMEQAYTAMYFAVFGPFGVWVMSRTPVWYFNTIGMYEGFPHRSHEAWFKAYYLLQASYWAQQALVLTLQLEKPRKDFRELVLHHIVTLSLIFGSYRFHFTYMGIAVYITHDISDFFLATSKVFNYLDLAITGPYFVIFMAVWAYTRHYLNILLIISILPPDHIPFTNIKTGEFVTVGPWEVNWEAHQYKCWVAQPIALGLLVSLQAINIFWFYLICRILARIVFVGERKDDRSDSEEEEEDEEDESVEEKNGKMVQGAVKTNGHATKPTLAVNGKPISS